ncbi:hypothetical protein [Brevundimonas variabilis]|uniref:DUF2188 domain-containing protein n=1 Tax=Brevundimonas variabilis TaxID=74312 RepID=A0A7W9CFX2_9CAUL|nr:hypothetical protein [Brevundimonas variabilis]MBB5744870.1 hypothetical protein [Brevundimonas variabilis]
MMSGYLDTNLPPRPRPGRTYEIVKRNGGWCIGRNGVFTGPLAGKAAALALCRRLQKQADRLA